MRRIQIIFITVVLLAILFPILKFNSKGTVSRTENRTLATKPLFSSIHNFSDYDNYFLDRFGGRTKLIKTANFIDYNFFHKIRRNDSAFEGKNGWYFYVDRNDGDNFSDFNKTNLLTKEQIENFKSKILKSKNWCNENGIKCLFIICPNKHSVYSEYYPFDRPAGITRADQIASVFNQLDIHYVFPRDFLLEQKKKTNIPLYYETDTHWNQLGAYYAYLKIKPEIEKLFTDTEFPEWEAEISVDYNNVAGDILPMLSIQNAKRTQPDVKPKDRTYEYFFTYNKNEDINGVKTKGTDESLPKAIIYRDSFFTALTPYVSTLFSEAEYKWMDFTESEKEYVLQNKPDIIIFEHVERYALSLGIN